MGGLGAVGSAAGGALFGGLGGGTNAAANASLAAGGPPLAPNISPQSLEDVNALNGGSVTGDAAGSAPGWMDTLKEAFDNPKQLIGSSIGGMIGSNIGQSLVPAKMAGPPVDNTAPLPSPPMRAPPVFPSAAQLQHYGQGPQFNFYPS